MNYHDELTELMSLPGTEPEAISLMRQLVLNPAAEVDGWNTHKVLAALNVTEVAFDSSKVPDEVHGYSTERQLAINRGTQWPTKVLWHELGHILCDHTTSAPKDEAEHRLREAEAEAVAYVLCNVYRYRAGKAESRYYVQHWFKDKVIPPASVKTITNAVTQIIAANGWRPE